MLILSLGEPAWSAPRSLAATDPQRGSLLIPENAIPTWQSIGSGLNGIVYAIVVNGSDFFVGCEFTDAGGDPNSDRIARWDGTTWHALGSGLNNYISTIAINGSGAYVGGHFINAGGDPNADHIARWNGTAWYALGTGLGSSVQ